MRDYEMGFFLNVMDQDFSCNHVFLYKCVLLYLLFLTLFIKNQLQIHYFTYSLTYTRTC